ncbi:hypothetical protein LQ50_25270 [Halalkalibacter okhensis]|uniref:Aminotransferase class V domain-containing protein n=1 Tax=Halalkalibacter okhensis TaxID=333138 RepID=A0A0B0I965_9BACI|nr:hypothetical protein LQ50_25270 [Halalkalibacter okhensis]
MTYLDNASTSFPKPIKINNALAILNSMPATVNRRGYSSEINLGNLVEETRNLLKGLICSPKQHSLIFTMNATYAINMGIRGFLEEGDHVITTDYEHSSISRTLTSLKNKGFITFSKITLDRVKTVDNFEQELSSLVQSNTRALIMTHASNVNGDFIYKREYGEAAKRKGLITFVDASQSIGNTNIHVEDDYIDMMAFSCHKSLMGLSGLGGLYFSPRIKLQQLITGGTGIRSESDEITPERETDFETGTVNLPAILSLRKSLQFINEVGLDVMIKKKKELKKRLLHSLEGNEAITNYSSVEGLPIVSFNIKGLHPVHEVGPILENSYEIITRAGLHCSPWTHKKLGTFPVGTVRVSPGYFNSKDDIDKLSLALNQIALKMQIS